MEAWGRLWGGRVFFELQRVRGVFFFTNFGDFLEVFRMFLEVFLESVFMICWRVDFCKKIVDFLKSGVLRQREHHF